MQSPVLCLGGKCCAVIQRADVNCKFGERGEASLEITKPAVDDCCRTCTCTLLVFRHFGKGRIISGKGTNMPGMYLI